MTGIVEIRMRLALSVVLAAAWVAPSIAADDGNLLSLEELLSTYESSAGGQPPAEVALEGRIEAAGDGSRELVIVLQPEGETKLNADPGITVTPGGGESVAWQVALPYRHVDRSRDYFEPEATVRMPFAGGGGEESIRVLVEFAYCVVDYQCFFGEEELEVANLID